MTQPNYATPSTNNPISEHLDRFSGELTHKEKLAFAERLASLTPNATIYETLRIISRLLKKIDSQFSESLAKPEIQTAEAHCIDFMLKLGCFGAVPGQYDSTSLKNLKAYFIRLVTPESLLIKTPDSDTGRIHTKPAQFSVDSHPLSDTIIKGRYAYSVK